jgi:prepilin-type processing-associated H-X9-DG protein
MHAWKPRDTMAWLSDGTSNVIVVGEKHVSQPEMNRDCCDNKRADGSPYTWDGGWCEYTVARQVRVDIPLAPTGNFGDPDPAIGDWAARQTAFGSFHPGAIHFLMGDGSVKAFGTNMNVETFRDMANVQDGRTASL